MENIISANGQATREPRTHYAATDWMKFVDGDLFISEISIPGTHESGTYNVYESTGVGYVKCQSLSFTEQLNIGCRYLDIRLRTFNEKNLLLYHGIYPLHLDFSDVLRECTFFLNNHPSEVILMCVKGSCAPDISSTFLKYYSQDTSIWYTPNRIPKLDQVRGKIVLLSRISAPLGIDARFPCNSSGSYQFQTDPPQTLFCEDRYNPSSLNEKISNIERNIRKAEDNVNPSNLFLTITSGYMVLWYTPYGMSCKINEWLVNYLWNNRCKNKGIVALDFVDSALAKLVINNNFTKMYDYKDVHFNGYNNVRVNSYGNVGSNENSNMTEKKDTELDKPTLQDLNMHDKLTMPALQAFSPHDKFIMPIRAMKEKEAYVTIENQNDKGLHKVSIINWLIYVICLVSSLFTLFVILIDYVKI